MREGHGGGRWFGIYNARIEAQEEAVSPSVQRDPGEEAKLARNEFRWCDKGMMIQEGEITSEQRAVGGEDLTGA